MPILPRDHVVCPRCDGTGCNFCPACGNANYMGGTSVKYDGRWWVCCPTCEGWGYDRNSTCSACNGSGDVPVQTARMIRKHVPRQVG